MNLPVDFRWALRGVTGNQWYTNDSGRAAQLQLGRDLGEPFNFLTGFQYAAGDAGAFEDLMGQLRSTEEWKYVEREVDVRRTLRG